MKLHALTFRYHTYSSHEHCATRSKSLFSDLDLVYSVFYHILYIVLSTSTVEFMLRSTHLLFNAQNLSSLLILCKDISTILYIYITFSYIWQSKASRILGLGNKKSCMVFILTILHFTGVVKLLVHSFHTNRIH